MKMRFSAALAIASIAATASAACAGMGAATGVNGSMHDLNSVYNQRSYAADALQRSCVFCHTPHNARSTVYSNSLSSDALAPLWNHADATTPTMSPYAWVAPTNKAIPIYASDPLIGPSRLCMACHDGVTAVDAHGSANGYNMDGTVNTTTGSTVMTATYQDALKSTAKRYITDLTVTHPIGFLYDDAVRVRGNELVPKTTGFITGVVDGTTWNTWSRGSQGDTVNGGVITHGVNTTSKKIQDTLYNGYMTCATCHDVHNSVNAVPASGNYYNYFLYAQEEGSAICLSCHVK